MRILCIDCGSNALDWLIRCQDAGHQCLWYDRPNQKDGKWPLTGKGIVPKLQDFDALRKKWLGWADLIFVTDNAHYIDFLDPYRKLGYPIFGPGPDATDLELNRAIGQKAMKACGLKTIPSVAFTDYEAAARYVEKHPTFLVSKPSGDADKALSFVADDAASLSFMLMDRWAKNEKLVKDSKEHGFILQEKIQGFELAVGGWFGPGGWSKYWYSNIEHKPLMAGDMGPNTGEMGTLSMYVKRDKLADIALKPLTKMLAELEYVGFIDVAGMVDLKGQFYPFEFTTRPGWPTFHNQVATHIGDPAQWMVDLIDGRDTLKVRENICCVSIVLAIPDFPYSHLTSKEVSGIPVYGATDRERVHLSMVCLSENVPTQVDDKVVRMPGLVSCGDYIAVVSGLGENIPGSRKSAYAAARKVKMPIKPFYRLDIGDPNSKRMQHLPDAQKHGFATHFKV